LKICVVGYSGSGKSSFTYKLAKHYQIEETYLDKLNFLPNWKLRDHNLKVLMLEDIVYNKDSFIIDGNYSNLVIDRFVYSDKIFIFNFNRFKCLYGLIRRRIKYNNKTRNSMTEGNLEKLDLSFIYWVLFKSRSSKRRKFYKELKNKYGSKKVITFKNRKKVNNYLKEIGIFDFKERA
jgi:adenylate kinase family enzyme